MIQKLKVKEHNLLNNNKNLTPLLRSIEFSRALELMMVDIALEM